MVLLKQNDQPEETSGWKSCLENECFKYCGYLNAKAAISLAVLTRALSTITCAAALLLNSSFISSFRNEFGVFRKKKLRKLTSVLKQRQGLDSVEKRKPVLEVSLGILCNQFRLIARTLLQGW